MTLAAVPVGIQTLRVVTAACRAIIKDAGAFESGAVTEATLQAEVDAFMAEGPDA